jgi:WD40 repeat protein
MLTNIISFLLHILQDHTRFVQAVRYSPNGSHFASAGFDGKVFLYDGTSSDLIGEIGSPAHKGGVYAVSIKEPIPLYMITYLWFF